MVSSKRYAVSGRAKASSPSRTYLAIIFARLAEDGIALPLRRLPLIINH